MASARWAGSPAHQKRNRLQRIRFCRGGLPGCPGTTCYIPHTCVHVVLVVIQKRITVSGKVSGHNVHTHGIQNGNDLVLYDWNGSLFCVIYDWNTKKIKMECQKPVLARTPVDVWWECEYLKALLTTSNDVTVI